MSKLLPAVLVTLLITGMTIFAFYQSSTIVTHVNTIEDQKEEIVSLEESVQDVVEDNDLLRADNTLLTQTVKILRDSVVFLETEVSKLKRTIRQKNKTINSIQAKLKDIENQYEALRKMHSIVKDTGRVIISVPIEKGFPALVKNLIRKLNLPHSNHIFTSSNILKSFLGRNLLELRNDPGYMSHMGFYFTDLETEIKKLFTIELKSYSPIGGPTYQTNSQVFYELIKKV